MEERLGGVADALGVLKAGTGLRELAERIGAPTSLAGIGMRAADLAEAAGLIAARGVLDEPAARRLLELAYEGRWES
jgi:hypothetical protein